MKIILLCLVGTTHCIDFSKTGPVKRVSIHISFAKDKESAQSEHQKTSIVRTACKGACGISSGLLGLFVASLLVTGQAEKNYERALAIALSCNCFYTCYHVLKGTHNDLKKNT